MLQYAVDTKLDELLSTLWLRLTDPPMPLNPYPRLMHIIRCASPCSSRLCRPFSSVSSDGRRGEIFNKAFLLFSSVG